MFSTEAECTLLEEAGEYYGTPRARLSDWGQAGFELLGYPVVTTLNIKARYRITVEQAGGSAANVVCLRRQPGDGHHAEYPVALSFIDWPAERMLYLKGEPLQSAFEPGKLYRFAVEKVT